MADDLLKNVLEAERQGRALLEAAETQALARVAEANRSKENLVSAERGRLRTALERDASLARERADAAHAAILSEYGTGLASRPLDHAAFTRVLAQTLEQLFLEDSPAATELPLAGGNPRSTGER